MERALRDTLVFKRSWLDALQADGHRWLKFVSNVRWVSQLFVLQKEGKLQLSKLPQALHWHNHNNHGNYSCQEEDRGNLVSQNKKKEGMEVVWWCCILTWVVANNAAELWRKSNGFIFPMWNWNGMDYSREFFTVVINRLMSVTIQGHLTYQSCTERNSARVLLSLNYVGICSVILSDFSVILLMEEILHQLIGSLSQSHYSQGFTHPRWYKISSTNSTSSNTRTLPANGKHGAWGGPSRNFKRVSNVSPSALCFAYRCWNKKEAILHFNLVI